MIVVVLIIGAFCLLPLYVVFLLQRRIKEKKLKTHLSLTLPILTFLIGLALFFYFISGLVTYEDDMGTEIYPFIFLVCGLIYIVKAIKWYNRRKEGGE